MTRGIVVVAIAHGIVLCLDLVPIRLCALMMTAMLLSGLVLGRLMLGRLMMGCVVLRTLVWRHVRRLTRHVGRLMVDGARVMRVIRGCLMSRHRLMAKLIRCRVANLAPLHATTL